MYVTAILLLFLIISLFVSKRNNYKGLYSFDKFTTLPLRGLLALLILSHHLGLNSEIYALSDFTIGIGDQIVAVFFLISGYGLCVSYKAKGKTYFEGFLKKRLGKLLPKFILLTLGMIVIYHFFSDKSLDIQLTQFIKRGWTPLPYSWFIYAIIYVYLSFFVCGQFAKNPFRLGILFTLSIILYFGITYKILQIPGYWYMTIICVNLGYYIAYYEEKITMILERHKNICYSSLGAIMVLSFIVVDKITGGIFTEIWMMSQALSVYVIVRTLGFFQWSWLRQIGMFSLELYLIHGIPLAIGCHIGLENWTLWFFTYVVSIPAAIALNRIFDVMHKSKGYKMTIQ